MKRVHEILDEGIEQLEFMKDLEEGKCKNVSETICYYDERRRIRLSGMWNSISHDDLLGHYDNKKTDTSESTSILKSYPNALLVEDFFTTGKLQKMKPIDEANDDSDNEQSDSNMITESLTECMRDSDSYVSPSNPEKIGNPKRADIFAKTKCKVCGSIGSLIEDHAEGSVQCTTCGVVIEHIFDQGPEWRQYNNDDNRTEKNNRCGCPSNFFFPKSSQGTIMANTGSSRLRRKQGWDSVPYKEKSLREVFAVIISICKQNKIKVIISDTAQILYKKIHDSKHKTGKNIGKNVIIRGDNRMSIIAICVHKACEMNKDPRTLKEIAAMFDLPEKKLSKGSKKFDLLMKNADDQNLILEQLDGSTPEDHIRRCGTPEFKEKFLRQLKTKPLTPEEINMSVRVAANCSNMKLASDHNPQSVAVGAILVMIAKTGRPSPDRKELARIMGTSDVTVTKIYHKISPYADALVDDDATEFLIKRFKING